jgi:hypothetical protein
VSVQKEDGHVHHQGSDQKRRDSAGRTAVLTPAAALRKANVWLSMNAGHLLLAENPELVLREPLQWRFDVIYSLPDRAKPGTVRSAYLGKLQMDAASGEIYNQAHVMRS